MLYNDENSRTLVVDKLVDAYEENCVFLISNEEPHPPIPPENRTRIEHYKTIPIDQWEPIEVDFGCGPFGGHFEICDGLHRLAAAYEMGHKTIQGYVSGLGSIIKEFEGIQVGSCPNNEN